MLGQIECYIDKKGKNFILKQISNNKVIDLEMSAENEAKDEIKELRTLLADNFDKCRKYGTHKVVFCVNNDGTTDLFIQSRKETDLSVGKYKCYIDVSIDKNEGIKRLRIKENNEPIKFNHSSDKDKEALNSFIEQFNMNNVSEQSKPYVAELYKRDGKYCITLEISNICDMNGYPVCEFAIDES